MQEELFELRRIVREARKHLVPMGSHTEPLKSQLAEISQLLRDADFKIKKALNENFNPSDNTYRLLELYDLLQQRTLSNGQNALEYFKQRT